MSAAQFVDGLMAALSKMGVASLNPDDPDIDRQFAMAYDELLARAEELELVPDFVISADPAYRDSVCLRDAILDIRDSRSVALNNSRFVKMTLKFAGHNTPDAVLDGNTVPRPVLEGLARQYLSSIST